jgi:hypothetical protein
MEKRTMKMHKFLSGVAIAALLFAPLDVSAQVFNPATIIGSTTGADCVQLDTGSPSRNLVDAGAVCTNSQPIVNGDVVTGATSGKGIQDSGTLLSTLAPKASPTFTGHITTESVTATGATGTGNFVFSASPTLTGTTTLGATTQVAGTALKTGTAPAPTGTGTPTIQASSTDEAGEVTAGSSATSVIITFAGTYTNAPYCNVTNQSQVTSFAYTLSNTAISITQTSTSGNKIDYRCQFRG